MNSIRMTMTAVALVATLSACGPAGGSPSSPSPSVSAVSSPTPSASVSPTPAPTVTPEPSPGGDGTAGSTGVGTDVGADANGWVNGYIFSGSDGDVHFGPTWGPTWYFDKTIGEHFTDWPAAERTVATTCPWVASLDTYPGPQVYSVSVGDPGGDPSIALMFRMSNPHDPSIALPMNAWGITVASSMDDVLAAYPGTTVQFFNDEEWGDIYEIDAYQPTTDTHMYFWSFSPHGAVEHIQWGHFPWGTSWRGHTCDG